MLAPSFDYLYIVNCTVCACMLFSAHTTSGHRFCVQAHPYCLIMNPSFIGCYWLHWHNGACIWSGYAIHHFTDHCACYYFVQATSTDIDIARTSIAFNQKLSMLRFTSLDLLTLIKSIDDHWHVPYLCHAVLSRITLTLYIDLTIIDDIWTFSVPNVQIHGYYCKCQVEQFGWIGFAL